MAYHVAESEFLSRRAIAAATIIALHVLVARDPYAATRPWRIVIGSASSSR